ncbi:MAG: hypothetical protein JXA09_17170 [Anaerolineae bacterium]|nr:hypothetical protein [Anaerolineae bacterium]
MRTCLAIGGAETALEDAVDAAARGGFRCLDLHVSALEAYLSGYPVAVLGALLAQRGVHVGVVSGLTLPPLARGEDRVLADAQLLELCAHLDALGGGIVALRHALPPDARRGSGDMGAVHVLRSLADLVAPFDVRLAVEVSAAGNAATDLERADEIVTRARRAWVGLALDLRTAPARPANLDLPQHAARVHLVRLGTLPAATDRGAEGRRAALRALCAALIEAQFHGVWAIDVPSGDASLAAGARAAFEAAQALFASLASKER